MTSQEQELLTRVARAMQASKAWPAVFDAGSAEVLARAAIEAYEAGVKQSLTTCDVPICRTRAAQAELAAMGLSVPPLRTSLSKGEE